MQIVQLYITKFESKLPEERFNQLLNIIPDILKSGINKYRYWQDRHSCLLGKILLLWGLRAYGYSGSILENLKFSEYNRPFLNNLIDFNISHSGKFVICAIGENIRLGVDIEQIRSINLLDFYNTMSKEQFDEIVNSRDKLYNFFKYWTIKESSIKADGRGLSISLPEILINKNEVLCNFNCWFIHKLSINKDYCSHLATNVPQVKVKYHYVDVNDILQ